MWKFNGCSSSHFLKKAPIIGSKIFVSKLWLVECLNFSQRVTKTYQVKKCQKNAPSMRKVPKTVCWIWIRIRGSGPFWLDPDPPNYGSRCGSSDLTISMDSWQNFEWFTFLKFENPSSGSKVMIFFIGSKFLAKKF